MSRNKLTDAKVRAAKPQEKEYSLGDGDGLYLKVKPNGTKSWLFNYSRPNKTRANISFGTYPDVSLIIARERRGQARALLSAGTDPQTHRQEQILLAQLKQQESANTFEHMANQWIELKRHQASASGAWRSLERHVLPFIGTTPITQIRAPQVIDLFRPLAAEDKHETVQRLCQRVNEILDYSVNHGLLEANPCTAIHKVFKRPSKQHMPTLKPNELPQLMRDIHHGSMTLITRCLIEWSLHTLVRPAEAAGTRWDEIDLENKVWHIPANRMKMNRPQRIPLSPQILSLLEYIKPISGHRPFVFPGRNNPMGYISVQSANSALKRLGYGGRLVAHGLRSLGSTILNEQGFNPDVIEAALSHADKNEIRRTYNRSDYLDQRVVMMAWWSNHIEQASQGSLSLAVSRGLSVSGD